MRTVEATTERRKPRFRSVNADLAGEINQELAHLINAACRELDPDDRDQLRMYWQVHDELFDILEMAFLLMTDEGVTVTQGKAIAAAMRSTFAIAWRAGGNGSTKHLREKLAEIDADVRALMGDEEYPDEDHDEPELEPEPTEPKPSPGSKPASKSAPMKFKTSFFKRYR